MDIESKYPKKIYAIADINFLSPLSAQAQQAKKIDISSAWCLDITFHWLYINDPQTSMSKKIANNAIISAIFIV